MSQGLPNGSAQAMADFTKASNEYINERLSGDLKDISAFYAPPRGAFFVAVDDQSNSVIGCAGMFDRAKIGKSMSQLPGSECEVRTVSVDSHHRRRGIARALMDAIELLAAAQGYDRVVLGTSGLQPGARKLYESLGYKEIAQFSQQHSSFTLHLFTYIKELKKGAA